jgi:hypothetical protein
MDMLTVLTSMGISITKPSKVLHAGMCYTFVIYQVYGSDSQHTCTLQ